MSLIPTYTQPRNYSVEDVAQLRALGIRGGAWMQQHWLMILFFLVAFFGVGAVALSYSLASTPVAAQQNDAVGPTASAGGGRSGPISSTWRS